MTKRFRTLHSGRVPRVYAKPGNPFVTEYTGRYNERGSLEIVETGKYDIRQYIQSFADDVDLKLLLERFARGDIDALSRKQGQYFDATLAPGSYAEALNQLRDGERAFFQLPDSVRSKFNNNYVEWLNGIGSDAWTEKMTLHVEQKFFGEVKSDEPQH